jgi:hypothetical protein
VKIRDCFGRDTARGHSARFAPGKHWNQGSGGIEKNNGTVGHERDRLALGTACQACSYRWFAAGTLFGAVNSGRAAG